MNQFRFTTIRALAISGALLPAASAIARQSTSAEMVNLGLRGVYFVPSEGQWSDSDVEFGFNACGLDVALRRSSLTMHLARQIAGPNSYSTTSGRSEDGSDGNLPRLGLVMPRDLPMTRDSEDSVPDREQLTLTVTFPGSNDVSPIGRLPQDARFNYFVGGIDRETAANVPSFGEVVYESLYDGVDLHVMGSDSGVLKYEFHVAPGADASRICIAYEGIDSLCVDQAGNLQIGTSFGTLLDRAPRVWQNATAARTDIPAHFELLDDRTYAIALTGPVDPARELIIDPDVQWATFMGGTGIDVAFRVALDADGNAFVAGHTYSTDFEGALNTHHGTHPLDLFLAKLDSAGQLQWMTYLGGTAYDEDSGIAVDGDGNALITGNTVSLDFEGRINQHHGGTDDAFVVKVNTTGGVEWMTYLGGTATDYGFGITVDGGGNSFVAGRSRSTDFEGRTNTHHGGLHDGVVFKVNAAGAIQWATYLGGSGVDAAVGVDLDSSGNALVTGYTNSTNFQGAGNAYYGGQSDGFVVKVNPAGALQWATYLGGSGREENYDLAVNAAGDSFIAAYTDSADFDGRNNAYVFEDGAVVRVSAAGTVQWMTYLGGAADDGAIGIALDSAGDVLVAGYSYSTDLPGATNANHGGEDAFLAKVSSAGATQWSTYLGGAGTDDGVGLAINGDGDALISGSTESEDFEAATNTYHGNRDGFLAKVHMAAALQLTADGTCPSGGPLQISWSGATNNGTIALLFALNTGSFAIPNGNPCAGTALGLGPNQLQVGYQGNAGANGSRTLNTTAGPGACGGYLQLLDVATCGTSNVVQIQ